MAQPSPVLCPAGLTGAHHLPTSITVGGHPIPRLSNRSGINICHSRKFQSANTAGDNFFSDFERTLKSDNTLFIFHFLISFRNSFVNVGLKSAGSLSPAAQLAEALTQGISQVGAHSPINYDIKCKVSLKATVKSARHVCINLCYVTGLAHS